MLRLFLFVLPIQTIWIYREQFVHGAKWEYGTLGFYGSEGLLWGAFLLFMIWFFKQRFQISNFPASAGSSRLWTESVRMADRTMRDKFQISRDRIFVFFILLFTLYTFLSSTWAIDADIAFQFALHVMEAFLLFFMLFLGPLSFHDAVKWFVAGALAQSMLGLWQFFSQSTFASTVLGISSHPAWQAGTSIVASPEIGRWLRAYGSFSHPNVFGGYMVIALFFALIQTDAYGLRRDDASLKVSSSWWGKYVSWRMYHGGCIMYHVSFVLLTAGVFVSFSRSAWMAFVLGLLVYSFIGFREKMFSVPFTFFHFLLIPIITFIVFTTLFFPLVQTRLTGSSVNEVASISDRVSGYSEAMVLFKQHPFLGVGIGNYTASAFLLNPTQPAWAYQPVHNALLLLLVELGVVGIVLLLFVFFTYHISRITSQPQSPFFKWYVVCVLCSVFLTLFDHYLFSSYVGLLLGALIFGCIGRSLKEGI